MTASTTSSTGFVLWFKLGLGGVTGVTVTVQLEVYYYNFTLSSTSTIIFKSDKRQPEFLSQLEEPELQHPTRSRAGPEKSEYT